jgi:putative oxidoreductase
MSSLFYGVLALAGRLLLCTIFFMSAVGTKIPNFGEVQGLMEKQGVPVAPVMLVGAIVFLVVGSVSVIIGYKARVGALLLLVFLALATYYFHNFWDLSGREAEQQTIQFMKNLSMAGAMLFIMGNGAGPCSVDSFLKKKT